MPGKRSEALSREVARLCAYYTDAKDLLDAVRKSFPKTSKKDIILASFSAMIDLAEHDPAAAKKLHDFAISNRGSDTQI